MISPQVLQLIKRYRQEFDNASPFRNVVIDDFFAERHAEQLLADFPPFNPDKARNEFGVVGRKAVVTDIQTISPFYADVYRYIASPDFLDCISQVTGIQELVHDEEMFGGGTH